MIRATWNGPDGPSHALVEGLFGAFYTDFRTSPLSRKYDLPRTCDRLGDALLYGKRYVSSMMDNEDSIRYFMEVFELFGDPMLKLRLPEPD